jgi:hypothetical protein
MKKGEKILKKINVRKLETVKTTAAFYGGSPICDA